MLLATLALALAPQGPPPQQKPMTVTVSGEHTIPLAEAAGTSGAFLVQYLDIPDLTGKTVVSARIRVGVNHLTSPSAENLSFRNPALALVSGQSSGIARVGYNGGQPVESSTSVLHSYSAALTAFDGVIDYAGTSGISLSYADTGAVSPWYDPPALASSVPTDGQPWAQAVWLQFLGVGGGATGGNMSWASPVQHGATVFWEITYR